MNERVQCVLLGMKLSISITLRRTNVTLNFVIFKLILY